MQNVDVEEILSSRELGLVVQGDDAWIEGGGIALGNDEIFGSEALEIGAARDPGSALRRMAQWNAPLNSRLSMDKRAQAAALAKGARSILGVAAEMQARQALRPNSYCPITSPPIAAGASVTLTIQPGGGNGTWYFMGFHFEDVSSQFFGMTSLTIAGQQVIYGTCTASAGVIVAQGVSVGLFDTRNPNAFNLSPWMGVAFTNQQNIVMILTNLSNAADVGGGQYTCKGSVLTKVDPCNVELPGARTSLTSYAGSQAVSRGLSAFRRP